MILLDPKIEVENFDGKKIMKNIERACRTCYRSEGNITEDSYKNLLKNCINRGHESVLEHEKVTVRLLTDISFYKDVTRHRLSSFSIESTRYCNYSKDKYNNQIKFIKPCNLNENTAEYDFWYNCMQDIEEYYLDMSKLGCTPDQMRMILPHSTAAEVTMTANMREWKHIFELRCSKRAHPSCQQMLIPLLLYFKEQMPEIYENIEYNAEFPKEKYAKLDIMKEIN